ncbi:ATP synthase F0 subunit B [Lujinxingia vulgaris]|uniref:ATP synthase subunit b n=1 Tax=Lujinxingia vulgaris TaxID=2600176 RepID=A0A5C6XRD7_9DELT|nr:ATP synthase F0 subunit B [Lujinxingia vulgaris]TXD41191.1 ATP synthase F0 subunit B [Lujinxingia vulgaris]
MTSKLLRVTGSRRAIFVQVLVLLVCVSAPAFAASGESAGFPWKYWFTGIFNLVVFLGIIVKFGGPAIRDFFASRRETFLADMNAAKLAREQAEARLAELNAKLEALERDRQSMLDEYHAQGEREKQRLIDAAKKSVEKMRADAELTIQQEVKRAVSMLEEQAVNTALEMAQRVARERVDAGVQNKLVESYVSELGKASSAAKN